MSLAGPEQHRGRRSAGSRDVQERILDAVSHAAGKYGLPGLTVDLIQREAEVSRASFYQYFSSIDDCFWNTYHHHGGRLLSAVRDAVAAAERPELAALGVLVAQARERPDIAQLLMREGLGAGASALEEREWLIGGIVQAIEASGRAGTIDLPLEVMTGGVFRFLSLRLDGGGPLERAARDIEQWAGTFSIGPGARSWSSEFAPRLPGREKLRPEAAGVLANAKCALSQRERIIWATAATVRDVGYRNMQVENVCARAGVSRRSFYNAFPTKAHAFMASYEYAFQQTVAACTAAFFGPRVWRERIWDGFESSSAFFAREPLLAYLGFVESYAVGRQFALRVHDTQLAFTLFLEDGYRQRPQAEQLSRDCSELTAATIFEAGFQASVRGPAMNIRRVQPLSVYIALAPFIGRDAAGEFVQSKLSAERAGRPARPEPRGARMERRLSAQRSARAS
jgi:TetR/AcrR family transcriptional regulator